MILKDKHEKCKLEKTDIADLQTAVLTFVQLDRLDAYLHLIIN